MKFSDKSLIELLKQGNEEAYKYIYDRYYSMLSHIAYEFIGDSYLAETIVGDTIFHLWEIRDSIEIDSSLISYLVRAVRNRCINHLNLEYRQKEISFSKLLSDNTHMHKYIISEDHPLGLLLENELEQKIENAIESLPEECKRVFKKSRYEGQSYTNIATDLGISINTVKYHIKNAILHLQKDLKKYFLFIFFFI